MTSNKFSLLDELIRMNDCSRFFASFLAGTILLFGFLFAMFLNGLKYGTDFFEQLTYVLLICTIGCYALCLFFLFKVVWK